MSRRLLAFAVGMGLFCGTFAPALIRAQERDGKNREANSSRDSDDGSEGSAAKIDKALRGYQSRTEQDVDQTRKELDRLRKELNELNDLRLDMAVSLAQIRAEMRAADAEAASGVSDSSSSDKGDSSSAAEQSHRRTHSVALYNEYRQLQDSLRAEIQQARSATDQSVEQLRALRAQQRQRQEQLKAERERNKKAEEKSKEKSKDESAK